MTPRYRFEANCSNEVHHFGFTQSEYLFPYKIIDDNWVLKLRNPVRKLTNSNSQKLFLYSLTDDYSGCRLGRYFVSEYPSDDDLIFFLMWAWEKNSNHHPFRGLPKALFLSNKLAKNTYLIEFCRRASVKIVNYEISGARKIAYNFKLVWNRFENHFYWHYPNYKEFEIVLKDLNNNLFMFWQNENKKPHRRLKSSRESVWLDAIQKDELFDIEPGTWGKIYNKQLKNIDKNGCFNFMGKSYKIDTINSCDIYLCELLVSGELFAIDPRDGYKYRIRNVSSEHDHH